MVSKIWQVQNDQNVTKENIVELLLENRGIHTEDDKTNFLTPPSIQSTLKTFPKDFLLALNKGKKLLQEAIAKDIPVVVYGDYDADGICATAILSQTFSDDLNIKKSLAFIPNRFDHGYGLSKDAIDAVIAQFNTAYGSFDEALLVTVDTGITAYNEVEYAKSKGFTVIITDHHQKPEQLPECECLIWSDLIVGSGIAWIFSKVLGSKSTQSIALAALATITDVQSVIGVNRALIKEGLEVINTNPPYGLKALIDVSGLKGELTTYHLGWALGPRINATGRIKDSTAGLKLLSAKTNEDAARYAKELNAINITRQDKTLEMYDMVNISSTEELPKVIISEHKDYHEGIIGLVASRLVKTYHRPSIVISINDGHGKGSVRSINGVNIIEMLRNFEDLFESLGGHPLAAGFSIKVENIPVLKEKLVLFAQSAIDDVLLIPVIPIDLRLPINEIDLDLLEKLAIMKPFGIGNPEPVFHSESVGVSGFDIIGKDRTHLSLKLYNNGSILKGIFFGGAAFASDLVIGSKVDIVYTLSRNEFNGRVSVDLLIKDLKTC